MDSNFGSQSQQNAILYTTPYALVLSKFQGSLVLQRHNSPCFSLFLGLMIVIFCDKFVYVFHSF